MSREKNYSEVLAYAFSEGAELTGFDGPLVQGLSEGFKEKLVEKMIVNTLKSISKGSGIKDIVALNGDIDSRYRKYKSYSFAYAQFLGAINEILNGPAGKDFNVKKFMTSEKNKMKNFLKDTEVLYKFLSSNKNRFKEAYGSKKDENDSKVIRALFEAIASTVIDDITVFYIALTEIITAPEKGFMNKANRVAVNFTRINDGFYMNTLKLSLYLGDGTMNKIVSRKLSEAYNGEMFNEDNGILDQALKSMGNSSVVKAITGTKAGKVLTATAGVVGLIIILPTIIARGYEMRQSVSAYFEKLASDMDLHIETLGKDTTERATSSQEKFSNALHKLSDKMAIDVNSANKKAQKTAATINVSAAKDAKADENGETSGVGLAALL